MVGGLGVGGRAKQWQTLNEAGCLFVAAQLAARPQHARTLETGMIQINQRTNGQCE